MLVGIEIVLRDKVSFAVFSRTDDLVICVDMLMSAEYASYYISVICDKL